jgi:hypothetical protein
MLRTVTATRYVAPLREGGSLPALVEADDDGMYVLKFQAAGQGRKALIAELLAGELARALALPVPEIVFVELDAALGRNEPDSEIQALVTNSAGLNLALDFLPGALAFDALAARQIDPALAARIVWFDALTMNVDRTPRNTNMLFWHRQLWLIDHGASLYLHHTWPSAAARYRSPFTAIKEHVLLRSAGSLRAADEQLAPLVTAALLERLAALIPAGWLAGEEGFAEPEDLRAAYIEYLLARLEPPRLFVEEAIRAAGQRV